MSETESGTRSLRRLGMACLTLYAALAIFFWTAWSHNTRWINDAVMIAATGALGTLYFAGLKFVAQAPVTLIVMFAVGLGLVGFLMPPFDSTDVFFYMATGWQQAHYGANPYSASLRSLDAQNDPMIRNQWMTRNRNPWLDIPTPYGFLFTLLARGLAFLGDGNFWLTLDLFAFMNVLMHAGTAWLLWKAGKLLPDGSGKVMLYLYTWNPFVVLQYLADLHNDIIVAFLIVAAAYLLLKRQSAWGLPLLVAAGLIKYVALVLVPFVLVSVVRQRKWKNGIQAAAVSAGLIFASAWPYAGEIGSFQYRLIWAQVSESTGSLHAFVMYTLRAAARLWPPLMSSLADVGRLVQAGLWVLFAIFVVRELYVSWRDPDAPLMMIERWTLILFVLIFVASSQFYAWYLGMVLPLALLTRRRTILADCVIALSVAHMLSFTFLSRKAIGYFLVATLLPVLYSAAESRRWRLRQIACSVH